MTQGTIGTVSQARVGPMPTGGRYGWYRDHLGNEFQRVSSLIKRVQGNTWNLDRWKERQVAEGLALRDDLVLSIKAMGRPDPVLGWSAEDKKKINGIVRDAQNAAKQRDGARTGTAVHDLTERLDRGEPLEQLLRGLPAVVAETLRAYAFLQRENGWRVIEIERTVVNDEVEAAGTFDRVELVPGLAALLGPGDCQYGHAAAGLPHDPGPDTISELPVIGDVKTETEPWRNGLHIAPQLAIYSRARKMWRATGGTVRVQYGKTTDPVEVPAGEYVPAPCVRQDVGVVMHLLDGRATPYFVDLNRGWRAALRAHEQAEDEWAADRKLGDEGAWFAAVPGIREPARLQMFTEQAAAANYAGAVTSPATSIHICGPEVAGSMMATAVGMEAGQPGAFDCGNCAPLAAGASVTRVDGTYGDENCHSCGQLVAAPELASAMPVMVGDKVASSVGDTLTVDGVQTHEAVRGPDGLVRWKPVDPATPAAPLDALPWADAPPAGLDETDRQAIEAIWKIPSLEGLGSVWELYTGPEIGRQWRGPVAQAAEARKRQIECPQRALHTGQGKCACGWTDAVPA